MSTGIVTVTQSLAHAREVLNSTHYTTYEMHDRLYALFIYKKKSVRLCATSQLKTGGSGFWFWMDQTDNTAYQAFSWGLANMFPLI